MEKQGTDSSLQVSGFVFLFTPACRGGSELLIQMSDNLQPKQGYENNNEEQGPEIPSLVCALCRSWPHISSAYASFALGKNYFSIKEFHSASVGK